MTSVLIFANEFPPDLGGAGVVAYQNAIELHRRGYKVTVLTRKSESRIQNYPFNVVEINKRSFLWSFQLLIYLLSTTYDFYFLNDQVSIYLFGLIASKEKKKRAFCFVHGSEINNIFKSPSVLRRFIFFKKIYIEALKSSRKVIFPSENMLKRFFLACNHSNISSIVSYAGISSDFFVDPKINFRHKLSIPDEATILLSVSRVHLDKGYLEKYQIFKNIYKTKKDLFWVVVGDGPFLNEFKKLVEIDGFSGSIIFLGRVPREELLDIYHSADLFWLLSKFEESFGLVYIEANACGLPCIGSNLGAVEEAIINGVSGFIVNSSKECEDLILKGTYLKILSDDCFQNAQRFIIQSQFQRIEDLL